MSEKIETQVDLARRTYGEEAARMIQDSFDLGVIMGRAAMIEGMAKGKRAVLGDPATDTLGGSVAGTLAKLAAEADAKEREGNPLAGCFYNEGPRAEVSLASLGDTCR